MVASSQKDLIHVLLTYQKDKNSQKDNIYEVLEKESGDFNTQNQTEEGLYELCFFS